jgi:hypothetical protein
MIVLHGLILASVGVAAGAGAAVGLLRLMKSLLFEVSPLDPVTYAAVAAVVGKVALRSGGGKLHDFRPDRRQLEVVQKRRYGKLPNATDHVGYRASSPAGPPPSCPNASVGSKSYWGVPIGAWSRICVESRSFSKQ